MKPIFKEDNNLLIRLDWPTVCNLAVKACCIGVSFDALVERALGERLYGIPMHAKQIGQNTFGWDGDLNG